jgi:hypothetical protein
MLLRGEPPEADKPMNSAGFAGPWVACCGSSAESDRGVVFLDDTQQRNA